MRLFGRRSSDRPLGGSSSCGLAGVGEDLGMDEVLGVGEGGV